MHPREILEKIGTTSSRGTECFHDMHPSPRANPRALALFLPCLDEQIPRAGTLEHQVPRGGDEKRAVFIDRTVE